MKDLFKKVIAKFTEPSVNRLRNILIVVIVVLSVATLVGAIILRNNSKEESARLERIASLKTSEAPTERVLLIKLSINGEDLENNPFQLTDVSAYNSHMDSVDLSSKPSIYKLKVSSGQNVFESNFAIDVIESETINLETKSYTKLNSTTQKVKTLKTPYFPIGSVITITDNTGKTLYEGTISSINEVNNASNYNTVAGEDVE